MVEKIGFAIGVIIFIGLVIFLLGEFIIIPLIVISLIGLVIYILDKTNTKHTMSVKQDELQDTLDEYVKVKKELKIKKDLPIVIIESYSKDVDLIIGENLLFETKNSICLFPNSPTLDNYLLYDEIKIVEFNKKDIELESIGNIIKSDDTYSKMLNEKLNLDINQEDERRTLLTVDKDIDIILDYYALEKIEKLLK